MIKAGLCRPIPKRTELGNWVNNYCCFGSVLKLTKIRLLSHQAEEIGMIKSRIFGGFGVCYIVKLLML